LCEQCDYPSFLFWRWPFNLVADSDAAKCWAGPHTKLVEVNELIQQVANFPETRLHLVWGELGVGKSHALRYMVERVASSPGPTVTAYTEIAPRDQVRSFLSLYSRLIREMDLEQVVEAHKSLVRNGTTDQFERTICRRVPSLVGFFRAYESGVVSRPLLIEWLAGTRLSAIERRSIGVSMNIDNDEVARDALVALVDMLRLCDRRKGRFVWAVDEFQRIKRAGPKRLLEISDMFRSLVNNCPNGLALLLGVREASVDDFTNSLTPDLKELIRGRNLHFAVYSQEEARSFLHERLAFFRCPNARLAQDDSAFPFGRPAISKLLGLIDDSGGEFRLKPRDILYCAGEVCRSALGGSERTGIIEPETVDRFFPERAPEE